MKPWFTQSRGELYFSTIPDSSSPILGFLREKSLESQDDGGHYLKQINNVVYNIRSRDESLGEKRYKTFCFSESRATSQDPSKGVRCLSRKEAEERYRASFYSVTNLTGEMQDQIQNICSINQPLIVWGEEGTCKEQVVCHLYANSALRKTPLVIIDCFLVSEKSWSFLMDHHNSPLAQNECLIFINDVDTLTPLQRHQLITSLLTMDVCSRNRVILSCTCGADNMISEELQEFMERVEGLNLFLPPLRQRTAQMPELAAYYMNHLNTLIEEQTLCLDDCAMACLQAYGWPNNYSQFQRVMRELALSCAKCIITESDVKEVLAKEKYMVSSGKGAENRQIPLDLRMTLDDLNKEIVHRVLEEEGGYQSATARRLGIGRTTLWWLLNNP